tara:strand:+ start:1060 stop:1464 length:405 start_codon:yes stop_codon:yes gene_type:complete
MPYGTVSREAMSAERNSSVISFTFCNRGLMMACTSGFSEASSAVGFLFIFSNTTPVSASFLLIIHSNTFKGLISKIRSGLDVMRVSTSVSVAFRYCCPGPLRVYVVIILVRAVLDRRRLLVDFADENSALKTVC